MALAEIVPMHGDPDVRRRVCDHPPTTTNRFCGQCGALILAHEVRWCAGGHPSIVQAGSSKVAVIFCGECDEFVQASA